MRPVRFFLLLALLLVLLPAAWGCHPVVTNAGETISWKFDFKDFSELQVDHGFVVDIQRSAAFSLNLTIDKAVQEYLVVEQHGQVLRVGLENGPDYQGTFQRASITMPELRSLELSAGSAADVSGFETGQEAKFSLSGGSSLVLAGVTAGKSEFKLSGASSLRGGMVMTDGRFIISDESSVELEGSASDIRLEGSGASRFDMEDLPAQTAGVELSGASRASINVGERLDFNLSGASELGYHGDPLLRDIKLSGGSTVNKL